MKQILKLNILALEEVKINHRRFGVAATDPLHEPVTWYKITHPGTHALSTYHHHHHLLALKRAGIIKFTIMARRPQETTRLITETTSAVINK